MLLVGHGFSAFVYALAILLALIVLHMRYITPLTADYDHYYLAVLPHVHQNTKCIQVYTMSKYVFSLFLHGY
jgi:hypothetical protein